MTSVAEGWEERVASFIEDNRPLLEDPELGLSAAQRLLAETLNLLTSLIWASGDAAETLTPAANALAHAIRDPHCSAGKVHKREKAHERLKAEYERLLAAQERLEDFRDEAQAALDRIQDPVVAGGVAPEAPLTFRQESEPDTRGNDWLLNKPPPGRSWLSRWLRR